MYGKRGDTGGLLNLLYVPCLFVPKNSAEAIKSFYLLPFGFEFPVTRSCRLLGLPCKHQHFNVLNAPFQNHFHPCYTMRANDESIWHPATTNCTAHEQTARNLIAIVALFLKHLSIFSEKMKRTPNKPTQMLSPNIIHNFVFYTRNSGQYNSIVMELVPWDLSQLHYLFNSYTNTHIDIHIYTHTRARCMNSHVYLVRQLTIYNIPARRQTLSHSHAVKYEIFMRDNKELRSDETNLNIYCRRFQD